MGYVLITGASSGIGRAIAQKFASEKFDLIVAARSEDKLNTLKDELETSHGVKVVVMVADLAKPGAAQHLYDECKRFQVEILVNNAGFGDFSNAWDMDLSKAQEMLSLNVNALTVLSLNYVRDYNNKAATLINVASIGGYMMFPTAVTYCATKFYVSSFTEGLAADLQNEERPMRAKVLAPAATATEFFNEAYTNSGMQPDEDTDRSAYTPASILADYAFALYQSDKVVGYVASDGQLELGEPKFKAVKMN